MKRISLILAMVLASLACTTGASPGPDPEPSPVAQVDTADLRKATFAGGCFWCMEPPFEKLDGVHAVISGYAGGEKPNPTYKEVSYGRTKHTETIQVHYDPATISYEDLLQVFWRQIDPTDADGQFVDRGSQYRPEIFVHDAAQREAASESKRALAASGRFGKQEIVVPITDYTNFYPAEDYHQDFYKKDPSHYKRYRNGSGRDQFIRRFWGQDAEYKPSKPARQGRYQRPSDDEIKQKLTEVQYYVTQEEGTERPFQNAYWDNKREGIYVDVVTGEPLFSSTHKYKSGTGWPSFYQPLEPDHIVEKSDYHIGYKRTEVRSKIGDSHLGHVFEDGPRPTGLRYCINSAALRFIPVEDLEKEGYGQYASLF